MKTPAKLLTLAGVLLLGIFVGRYVSFSKLDTPLADFESLMQEAENGDLSPIVFSGFYIHGKNAVELRFDGKVALVDGEVCRDEALESAIRSARDRKHARYLIIVGGEKDTFGSLIEAAGKFRRLGFGSVVLMANVEWVDDGYHWPHPVWRPSP